MYMEQRIKGMPVYTLMTAKKYKNKHSITYMPSFAQLVYFKQKKCRSWYKTNLITLDQYNFKCNRYDNEWQLSYS